MLPQKAKRKNHENGANDLKNTACAPSLLITNA